MREIQMVDLQRQYEKIKEDVDQGIQRVVDSAAFIKGPEVKLFQSDLASYLDVKHVIPCGNGTDALQVAMMALGLQAGDEVITTTFTFVSTAEVIALLGLKPVLVDCDYETFLINTEELEKAITTKTKAIVPVHLFGQCANMEEILNIAKKHDLKVIEDAAQSMGAQFHFSNGETKASGTMGDFGCTSFFPSKNLGCFGDGGALFTHDDRLAEKAEMIVNHGMKVRYHHDEIGMNSRLDSIQAAVLRVKLKKLDQYNDARRKVADFYDREFAEMDEVMIPKREQNSSHVFHQYTLKVVGMNRDELREQLIQQKVPAMIYYPIPMHLQKAYLQDTENQRDFPKAEVLANQVLSLPMHTELDQEQLKYIAKSVKNIIKRNQKQMVEKNINL